jgi:hypothetical protein
MDQAHSFFGENFNIGKADDTDDTIEFTKGYDDMSASAYDRLMEKAIQLCKANPGLSRHQAFAKAYSDPANRALADADRVQRRSRHVHKDAADRLTERVAALRKGNPNIDVDAAIDRVKKRNPELVAAWRKGRTNVDPIGRDEMPAQDDMRVDNTWAPANGGRRQGADGINRASARVFDGSSTERSPRFFWHRARHHSAARWRSRRQRTFRSVACMVQTNSWPDTRRSQPQWGQVSIKLVETGSHPNEKRNQVRNP